MSLLCLSLLLGFAQCSRGPGALPKREVQVTEQRDDSLQVALELFQQSKEPGQVRSALNQISSTLVKQAAKSTSDDEAARKRLQELFRLDVVELEDFDAAGVRSLDAPYLESCFQFRDAARALEISGLPRRDQLALGLAWATRHVLLHEQRDDALPPHLVVQRGNGGVRDRALVFCELARQWQLDGCILEFPTKESESGVLVGIVVTDKSGDDLLLFDPRLGLPVPGPNGVATLADVRAKPELLKFSGIAPDQLEKAVVRLTSPTPGLAPRMRTLEELLATQEHVLLYHDVAALERRLAGMKLTVAPWPEDDRAAPPRRLRLFYPKSEGGSDDGQRLVQVTLFKVLQLGVLHKYQQMRVLADLGEPGQDMLTKNITAPLFHRYHIEPRLALLRGRHEDALKRADRIGTILDQTDLALQVPEDQFQQQIAKWRGRVIEAYQTGEDRVKQIWGEDQFILALMQVDDAVSPQRHERKMLSQIVLRACREALGNHAEWIKAACWEERAAKLDVQARERQRAGKDSQRLRGDVQSAWKNAQSGWGKFLYRGDVPLAQVDQRLATISALWKQGQTAIVVGLVEELHLDLHRALEARLRQAEASWRLGAKESARGALTKLRDDAAALEKLDQPRKLMQQWIDDLRGNPAAAGFIKRLELLTRDWTPSGGLSAFRQRVDRQLDAWKEGA